MPFAALTSTKSSLRASRVTLPHSRSRSSPPKMEGRQFHPYHVHRAEPSAFAARSSSSSTLQDGQQSNTVRPLEIPQMDDSVVRTIDFLALGTLRSSIPSVLKDPHPSENAPDLKIVAQTSSLPSPGLDFSEAEVRKAISSFPAGSSGGPSGLQPAHLKQLLQSPKAKELIVR